jgi:hypothetical protein
VDYVLLAGQDLLALEVKSSQNTRQVSGLDAFARQFTEARPMVLGTGGIPLALWMETPMKD